MKEIEIPFGAKDSELKGWEYTVPEGMEAEIKDGKIVVREKESEDERIRKGLIGVVSDIAGGWPFEEHRITKKEAIAYLEKQKEQKPVEIHIDNPNIQKFDPDVKVTTSDSSADGKELLYVSNKSYNIGYRDGVASAKQEWSEEDDQLIGFIFDLLNDLVWQKDWAMSKEECLERLKSLRPSSSEEQKERSHFVRQALSDGHMKKFIEIYSDECDCKVGDVVKAIIRKKD